MGLERKRALVTGAGTGLGREIALELARQGADVVLHYYGETQTGAESARDEMAQLGRRTALYSGDLRHSETSTALVAFALQFLGGLDILVNNAGLTETKRFLEFTPEDFDALYALNIRGQFLCAQAAVRHMQDQRQGVILNVASVHALASLPGYSVYAGTKGAIVAWSRQLAVELAPHYIRVNVVAPGWIDVPSDHLKFPDLDLDASGKLIPIQRVGQPSDVAHACAYLASDPAAYITGAVLVIDGGIAARLALSTPEATE